MEIIGSSGYFVSDYGAVRNPSGRILKPRLHTSGYMRISLGASREAYVHRLVLEAFVGPAPIGYVADHINRDRSDNKLTNLRWLSQYENLLRRIHPCGENRPAAILKEDQVRVIRAGPFYLGRDGVLAKEYGVAAKTISDARRGRTWTHLD